MSKNMPRRAFPLDERGQHVVKSITADTLANSGKLAPASLPNGSGIKPEDEDEEKVIKGLYTEILKANNEEQTVTGVVLEPETTDAQMDIYDANVIRSAAHDFCSNHNVNSKLGFMHKDFKRDFELYESWITPQEVTVADKIVKAGSWVITVKVNDPAVWKMVKEGKIKGFSIGGKAKVKKLAK
jgi:hypothetical protein